MRKIINLMFALAAVAFLSATLSAQPVVKPKSFYEGRTYTWTNANDGTVTSNLADPATDPRQIMALLKEVYTNKEIPGIWQCGYTKDGQREGTIDYTVKIMTLSIKPMAFSRVTINQTRKATLRFWLR